jgi:hypothetical protein
MYPVQFPRFWWAWALAATAAAIAVDQSSRPSHQFPKAKPVPLTRGVITTGLMESGYDARRRFTTSWFLQSNHVICSFHRDAAGHVQLHSFHPGQNPPATNVVLEPLAEREEGTLVFWAPSPDGRWLLTVHRLDDRRVYRVFDNHHSLHRSWSNRHEGRSRPDWLSDSSGFVEWPIRDGRLLARVYWLDRGQTAEADILDLPVRAVDGPDPLPQPCVPLLYSSPAVGMAVEFLVLSDHLEPGGWQRLAVALPEALRRYDPPRIALSPAARQIAWLCESTNRLPRVSFSRGPPFVRLQPRLQSSLFVSRPDGSQLVPLGRTQPGTAVAAVRWSPEGDSLSFVYRNELWIQPLPDSP